VPAIDAARARAAVAELLSALGEDPARPGLAETPARVAEAFAEMLSGTDQDAAAGLREGAIELDQRTDQLVSLVDIPFRSVCEHHLLPFDGTVGVAYLPGERLAGLGRIARAVDIVASRLQLQERLTDQLADTLLDGLQAHGVAVVVRASHSCLWARGTRTQGASAVTAAARGALEMPARRAEAIALLTAGHAHA
jgi:GTP cyclohydrolase I